MPLTIPHRASPIPPQVWHVHVWQIPLYPCNPAGHSAGSHLPEVASCLSHRAVRATPALHNSVKSHELSGRHHNVELKLCTASSYRQSYQCICHIWHHSHMTYPIPAHPCHRMHTSVPCRPPYVHICYMCPISCQSSKPRTRQTHGCTDF